LKLIFTDRSFSIPAPVSVYFHFWYPTLYTDIYQLLPVVFRTHSYNGNQSMPPMPHSYYQQHYYPNYQPFYNSAAAAWWAAYQPPAAGYYYGQYPDSSYAYSMQQYYESSAYPVVSSCFVVFQFLDYCVFVRSVESRVGVSHLMETPTPGPICLICLLCNFVTVYLTFVQFILQLKLCTLLCTFY